MRIYLLVTLLTFYFSGLSQSQSDNYTDSHSSLNVVECISIRRIPESIFMPVLDTLAEYKYVFHTFSNSYLSDKNYLQGVDENRKIGVGRITKLKTEIQYLKYLYETLYSSSKDPIIAELDDFITNASENYNRKNLKSLLHYFNAHENKVYDTGNNLFKILKNIELNIKYYGFKEYDCCEDYSIFANNRKFNRYNQFLVEGLLSYYSRESNIAAVLILDKLFTNRRILDKGNVTLDSNAQKFIDQVNLGYFLKNYITDKDSMISVTYSGVYFYHPDYLDYQRLSFIKKMSVSTFYLHFQYACGISLVDLASVNCNRCAYDRIITINLSDEFVEYYIEKFMRPLYPDSK